MQRATGKERMGGDAKGMGGEGGRNPRNPTVGSQTPRPAVVERNPRPAVVEAGPRPAAVELSPRSTRAVATFATRIRELFPACPEGIARDAALRWSLTCPPKMQEREARITHDETVRNALIDHVRETMTDWSAKVASGGANPLARKLVNAQVRDIVQAWKTSTAGR
jgi:hypothetical protein